jgi:hypothetical protein
MSARTARVTSRTRPPKKGTPAYEWWLAERRATFDSLRATFWQWCLGMRTAGLLPELPEPEKPQPGKSKPFDWRFPASKLFVELDGLSYDGSPSGHQTATGYERDRVKDAEAICAGWRVLRITGRMLESGVGYLYVERALGIHRRRAA